MKKQSIKHIPIVHKGKTYTLIIEPEHRFVVRVKGLPACFTRGRTEEEAITTGKNILALWLRDEQFERR